MGSVTGRFLGREPIGYSDGSNAYKANFITSNMDPTGEFCFASASLQMIDPRPAEGVDDLVIANIYTSIGFNGSCSNSPGDYRIVIWIDSWAEVYGPVYNPET